MDIRITRRALPFQDCLVLIALKDVGLITLSYKDCWDTTEVPTQWYYPWVYDLEVEQVSDRLDKFINNQAIENKDVLRAVTETWWEYGRPNNYEEWLEFEQNFIFYIGKITINSYNLDKIVVT